MKLYASGKITKNKKELWHWWDDKWFFDVMEELFPSDKHRGDLSFSAVMAQLTEVRLDIDFNANNSS